MSGGRLPPNHVRAFRLLVVEGQGSGQGWRSTGNRCAIGSHSSNDLTLTDPAVSRCHCEIVIEGDREARVTDLGSRNGTYLDGVKVASAFLRDGSVLRVGRTAITFELEADSHPRLLSPETRFGSLVGRSLGMREVFALLARAAATDATVLLDGETGTGKGAAAEAVHLASARKDGPFVVADCGAIPAQLLEAELFGHERGAFTGADARRIGVFEEADGGTLFLDEIGELPAELQPKLLRVLESREVRRLGQNSYRPINVRLIAATNRDLRCEVNAARFRPDLFYRLAVLRVSMPPLRQRPEDFALLVPQLLAAMAVDDATRDLLQAPEFISGLEHGAWPGNVRELRNHLERCLVYQRALPVSGVPQASAAALDTSGLPYAEARRQTLDAFEARYLRQLLDGNGGKVVAAARAADVGRVHFYRLLRRHGIEPG